MSKAQLWPTNQPPDWTPFERPTVNIPQACALVGVSRRTIYNWLLSGRVFYTRTAGGTIRIYKETLFHGPHAELRTP